MLGVAVVWAGIVAFLIGAISIVKPPRWLGIGSRAVGASLAIGGLTAAAAGAALPSPRKRSENDGTRLGRLVPIYQFHEFHTTRVRASAEAVYSAAGAVTADEIAFFRLLTWIRSPRWMGRARESILAPPAGVPILDVARRSGFALLASEPPVEFVFGTILKGGSILPIHGPDDFAAFDETGSCRVAMNFLIEPDGAGAGTVRLSTETRIFAVDRSAARRFAVYWRVIYPGSARIRQGWLQAIKRRAEMSAPPARGRVF